MTDEGPLEDTFSEDIAKTAVDFLIAEDAYASALLLSTVITFEWTGDSWWSGNKRVQSADIVLSGPATVFRLLRGLKGLTDGNSPVPVAGKIRDALGVAVEAVVPETYLGSIRLRLEPSAPYDGWRDEYLAQLRGDTTPSNQAVVASHPPAFKWNGLGFRSRTETILAQAFSRRGLLFFPNAAAVSVLQKYEPDFLVCDTNGNWGILEIHGDDFHPPETAAKEFDRGRWFKNLGVRVFEIFDARECYRNPESVVEKFLKLMAS